MVVFHPQLGATFLEDRVQGKSAQKWFSEELAKKLGLA